MLFDEMTQDMYADDNSIHYIITTQLVNLTPHTLRIEDADEHESFLEFPPSGKVARVTSTRKLVEVIDVSTGAIAIYRTEFGEIVDLPDPMPNTIYVVSGMVKARVPERYDVFAPGELIRDDAGSVVGTKNLSR